MVATSRLRASLSTRGISFGIVLLAVLLVPVMWQGMPIVAGMRLAWLDAYQALSPRERHSAPAVIVAIDERSIERFGQWPWPRSLVAKLIDNIEAADPAAIGVDLLFTEPDRLSPDQLAPTIAAEDPKLASRLGTLPRYDAMLAASIKAAPVVLGIAGTEAAGSAAGTVPFTPSLQKGGDAADFVRHYAGALRSVPEVDNAAKGHGLLSADTEGGVIRRVPMVAMVGAAPVLPLSLETLRVASSNPLFAVQSDGEGVRAVSIGDLSIPTQSDGNLWVHYTPHNAARYVSAADVLTGTTDASELEHKVVLVGVTALGAVDYRTTPLGERMPGIEVHAQVLENVFDGDLLSRPRWARWAEASTLVVFGLLLIYAVPRVTPRWSLLLLALLLGAMGASGYAAYKTAGVLIDALVPGAALALVFATMLASTLAEANAQRGLLRERLQRERESAAQIAGELDAARRIQVGILPQPESVFPGEQRFELFALMHPAREVGGDLYDFFMLDADRLFFLVGDVSGKGLPASIFMAVTKALCKSAALRKSQGVHDMLREAGAEIARENPEALFVTVLAGVLDVNSGQLEYCSAGHDAPFLLTADGREIVRLESGGGPPLCVVDDYPYESARHQLQRGDTLCLVTDGVTEAMNGSGELFGQARLRGVLQGLLQPPSGEARSVAAVGEAIRADVERFVAGAEAADDLTLLVLRWDGPWEAVIER